MKKLFITLLLLLLVGGGGVAYTLFGKVFNNKETAWLLIDSDDNLDSLKVKINEAASPSTMLGFDVFEKIYRLHKSKLQGRYALEAGQSMYGLLKNIRNKCQTPVDLVVPSVRTLEDMAGRLSSKLMMDSLTLLNYMNDPATCKKYGYDSHNLASMFIPNTYEVYWDVTPEQLLDRMKKESDNFWTQERKNKAKALNLKPEEVITLASIVDEETANNAEKPRIAGLYLNRLRIGMPLQSDPTVRYALGDFTIRRVLAEYLKIDSPYNTYMYRGLPPGPIRVPSISGIDAVLNHENNKYLYMCAKEDFSGTHNFAVTSAEHTANARRYIQALNARGIKR